MAGPATYDTRPMTGGDQDLVECARVAASADRLERVYPIAAMPRLQDLLAASDGSVHARFAFAVGEAGAPCVAVSVTAAPKLVCQRCLLPFSFPVNAQGELDLVTAAEADAPSPAREVAVMQDGLVSLRELAEEEVLLALPVAPMCAQAEACKQLRSGAWDAVAVPATEAVRPFGALRDLIENFDRT